MLKMMKVGVLGDKKRGEILASHELGKDFLKDNFGENTLPG